MPIERKGISFSEAMQEAVAENEAMGISLTEEVIEDEVVESEVDQPEREGEAEQDFFSELEEESQEQDDQPITESTVFEVPGLGQLSIKELIEGNMKDADYRQKTQELAEQRRDAEHALTLWQALQTDPQNTIQKLYNEFQQGKLQPQSQSAPVADTKSIEDLVEARVQEALANDPRLQQYSVDAATARVNNAFSAIEAENGVKLTDKDRFQVLSRARQLGTTDLAFVFDGLMQHQAKKIAQRGQIKGSASSKGDRGSNERTAQKVYEEPKSFKEALEQSLDELRLSLTDL